MSATEPLVQLLRRVRRAPPRRWPAEAAYRLRRAGVLAARRLADARRPTYGRESLTGPLAAFAPRLDPGRVHELTPDLADRCARYLEQRFDLLGSGWRAVVHGTRCPGFEGHRYRAPAVRPDPDGEWLAGQVSLQTSKQRLEAIFRHRFDDTADFFLGQFFGCFQAHRHEQAPEVADLATARCSE